MPNRRDLLRSLAAPAVIPGSALGLNGAVAPSDRITLATIGVGWMGGDHVKIFSKQSLAQYIAVCDVDDANAAASKAVIDKAYGNSDCVTYRAFEEVLGRRDIDAVTLGLPDHWHAIAGVLALRAGKDVYGEKPLAYSFREGAALRAAQRKYKRIWQTGSWQRSKENFRKACELVRNGRIGKVHTVEVGLPGGHTDFGKSKDQTAITAPPASLWYDRWLGPAPEKPYIAARVAKNWRWDLDCGGGQIMDWVGHHVDIAHWGMGWDDAGPYEVEGEGEYPPPTAIWNSATRYRVTCKYPGGVTMTIAGGHAGIRGGTKWIGSDGWVWVNRGRIEAWPEPLLTSEPGPNEIQLPKSEREDHYLEFLKAVKSRGATLTPTWVAVRSATPGWLGQIAMLTGRKLRWDAEKERILNDADASRLLGREMRIPYRL